MLERALRRSASVSRSCQPATRQKAYNAREGIETRLNGNPINPSVSLVRKHTMLERALRPNEPAIGEYATALSQKAYNAREGIETKVWTGVSPSTSRAVRKHTMLERALRPTPITRVWAQFILGQKAYNAREGIETRRRRSQGR